MDDYSDSDDNMQSQRGHIKLKEGVDIKQLLEGKGDTFEINFDSVEPDDNIDDDMEPEQEDDAAIIELTGACLGLDTDEENDNELDSTTPFEKLALEMKNVTEDGKIKKKIKKPGVGQCPPCNSLISIRYSNYLEYNDSPTDTAFMKKPYHFRLGQAGIYGLNIAVQTMKVNEIAWFLIHPDFAFGAMGHPPRIPPNSTFLFCIELLRFVDSGPALELDDMATEDRRKFSNAYKISHSLSENAKEYFNHNIKLAIREYNKAMTLLEECNLSNIEEQQEQQRQLIKIYSNLAVCYTKNNMPKKACTMCNNIYAIKRNTDIDIPAKVYFHNGRALVMLGDYQKARDRLLKAQNLEPHNREINEELKKVIIKINEEHKREKQMAQAFFDKKGTNPVVKPSCSTEDNNDEFRKEIRTQCQRLKESTNNYDIKLPWGLTQKERDTAKSEAERVGLMFREVEIATGEQDDQIIYIISKA